jgi:hypothetical protein
MKREGAQKLPLFSSAIKAKTNTRYLGKPVIEDKTQAPEQDYHPGPKVPKFKRKAFL